MLSRRRFLVAAAATAPALALQAQDKSSAVACADTSLPKPILALADRRKEIVPITVEEREARLERARELMKQYKIDAIVMTTGSSLQYFTGARWGQSERLFAYVIPAAAAPFVVCPYLERDRFAELLPGFPESQTTLSYKWQRAWRSRSDDGHAWH
jgi:Xaa-Pro dipeptidase